jgi:hypothetical protein
MHYICVLLCIIVYYCGTILMKIGAVICLVLSVFSFLGMYLIGVFSVDMQYDCVYYYDIDERSGLLSA